ncbi:MAG TPA: indolepyruvate ferredoxin oxidoreductase subunit alpha [Bacillota bacterium]|nr:indolepyruvate ferredoxin oxidoreductase subunit alpha [Bacillota bacterium]HOK69305.1 indolepyruvate ferredoxin oxidoreductase subunit alpha [Bacillota bacterium]HPP85637.1 indolepyruvate ferredoxin oxidoreductase subunit alpha [Bacillota bacterium]
MEKVLLLGNEAVARGLYEAGVTVVSAYPGTPSTEITESACKYDEIYTEWAPNEKVAFEVAFGASMAGARAFCAMKHVGLNVAADPLYTASYIGVNGGMVCAVADDPGMHSSQNEQDSRRHAIASKVPMLEVSDSAECLDFTKKAFDLSEEFDTPVLLRLTTRISHSRSPVALSERLNFEKKPYRKDVMKNVMMPAMARGAHVKVEERLKKLTEWADTTAFDLGINKKIMFDRKIGVIAAGSCYVYAREALGENASYLKLGIVNPLPVKAIQAFASEVETLYVIEELDDIIETHCIKLGLKVIGKEKFSFLGEFNQGIVRKAVLGEEKESVSLDIPIPPRPPVLCAGCPHRGLFYALKKFKLYVSGDIGCYTLGAQAPLSMMDSCVCMGASVSGLHGFNVASGKEQAKKSVAVIGDSTFIHSGITGLIDIAYNKGISTVIVLDNSITGMTGHQNNPANGLTIKGDPTVAVDLEALARAVGIRRVRVVDPFDIEGVRKVVAEELEAEEASLIISRRPCALLKNVKHEPAMYVDRDVCTGCKACLQVGCPAIMQIKSDAGKSKAYIDPNQCVGCGVCAASCRFGAIRKGGN